MNKNMRLRMAAVVVAMLWGLVPVNLFAKGGDVVVPHPSANFSLSKEFYFTFTENLHEGEPQSDQELSVFVASNYKTKGTIEVLGAGKTTTWKQSFTVDSMNVAEIVIPTGYNKTTEIGENDDEKPLRHAIHVTADNPIVVYALNHLKYTTDGYLVIPPSAWGTSYQIAAYDGITRIDEKTNLRSTSEFALVSAYDNTSVNIVLADNSMIGPTWEISHQKGTVVNVTLMKGEVYQMQSWKNGANPSDFSGTTISSNHPIGVVAGAKCTDVPMGVQACDHIVEMLPPTDTWGKEYFTYPFDPSRQQGDLWRCFALEPGTDVFLNGKNVATIDPTDPVTPYYETDDGQKSELKGASHWQFSKPVLMCQYITGQNYDNPPASHGDPSYVVLETREQFERAVVFACPSDKYGFANYINVVIDDNAGTLTGLRDSLTLDGHPIRSLPSPQYLLSPAPQQIPSTNFWVFHVQIPGGVHRLKAQSDFSAYSVGFKDYESYAWATALALKKIGSTDTLHPLIPTKLICGELLDIVQDVPHDTTKWGLAQFADDGNGIGWLHAAAPNNTYNFDDVILVAADSGFVPGDSAARVHIKVTNLRQNAHGALEVVDRGGNDTVYMYDYIADSVFTAPLYVFGSITPPSTKTMDVWIHNPMDTTVAVDSLWLVAHTVFSFTVPVPKFPLLIKKGDSVRVKVTYAPSGATSENDSIYVKFNCFSRPLTLVSGGSVSPCVAITDLDNGILTITGATITKDSTIVITNSGTGSLHITQIIITGAGAAAYTFAPEIVLPLTPATEIVIPPLGSDTIVVHFSATAIGTYNADVTLTTDATCTGKDTVGTLTTVVLKAGPRPDGFDFKTVRVNCTYTDYGITISNTGSAPAVWNSLPPVVGTDVGDFTLNNLPPLPLTLSPKGTAGDVVQVGVTFKPSRVGPRVGTWTADFGTSGKMAVSDSGYGKWPQFATATPVNFGNVDVNATNTQNAIAVNVLKQYGDSITINKITIDDPEFTLVTTPTPPLVMAVQGDTLQFPVQFKPTSTGNKTAQLCYTFDGAFNTCHGDTTVCITLNGVGQSPGISVGDWDAQRVFITTTRKGHVFITNAGLAPVKVDALGLAFGTHFAIDYDPANVPPTPVGSFNIPETDSVLVNLKFTPVDTISNPYYDSILVTNESLSPLVKGTLTGLGKVVIYTSAVSPGKDIHGTYGKESRIPISILTNGYTRPSLPGLPVDLTSLDSGAITKLHVKLSYDPRVLVPMTNDALTADLSNAITVGWTPTRIATPQPTDSILFDLTGGPQLTGNGGLIMNVRFRTMYAPTDSLRLYDTVTTTVPWVQWKHLSGLFILDSICGLGSVSKILYVGGASLQQSIPNPVTLSNGSASVSIPFALERDMNVKLVMYNSMGKEVAQMFEGPLPKGAYAVPFNLDGVPAGLYYYRLASEGTVQTRTMVVVH